MLPPLGQLDNVLEILSLLPVHLDMQLHHYVVHSQEHTVGSIYFSLFNKMQETNANWYQKSFCWSKFSVTYQNLDFVPVPNFLFETKS